MAGPISSSPADKTQLPPRFQAIPINKIQVNTLKNCRLVGVIAHLGQGENYGHYMSYVRIGKKWFIFNDDEITEVEDYMLESLWGYKGVSKCAYMLFYSL